MLTNPQFDLSNATETVALPNTSDVARFNDTNLSDTASSFTATIDWGDGTTTTGTIVGSNGSFTVGAGGHTYADENQFPALVTVTRTADSSQLLIAGTVAVADTDNFTPHGKTITYTPNTPLTNVTVATFTDSNTVNVSGDFTAQIDWGDGTTTTGTVQGSAGSFSIVGSHTYTAAGENTISVAFADDAPDAASGFVTGTAVSGFGGAVTFTSATEGTANNGVEVATFADTSGSHTAADYTGTIDWGDGTTTSATVSGSGQSFTVTGTHTYADEEGNEITGDSPLMKVSITRTVDSVTIAPTGTVLVSDADFLTGISKTVGSSPNQALTNVTVATFTDPYLGNIAGDFKATIEWGDGSAADTGTVSGSNGSFTVTGSHTYTANGQFNVTVGILEDIPSPSQIATVGSKAIIGLAPGQFSLSTAAEGVLLSGQPVATFNDGNTSDTVAAFTANIDWGDGTTTPGTIAGASGSFTVTGTHTFADEGDEPVAVSVTRTADAETATIAGTTTVTESDTLSITANNISGNPGQPFSSVQVATFTTSFTGNVASDFTAAIDWGDGTTTAGTIAGGGGSFTVTGSHTYTAGGNDTLKVTVADDAPGTATKTGTSTATINFAGQMVLNSATEATALPNNTPVATFSDSNGGDTAASFTATIDWGDGVTSAGTVVGGAGSFTVEGGHTYADEGNDTAKVVLTHTADGATSTVSGGVAVAEADVLTPHGTSFTANAHQVFSGTVATFSDSDTANVAGDFAAAIDWGDGQTTTGTVSGANGSFTVGGSHTYAATGQDTVKVKLTDDAPGTATATATTIATVNQAASVPYDFNGDGKSDLLFQNVNATPQIWLMNGTSVISQTSLPQPPVQWKIVGSGDFNADGDADILWINTVSNQPAIWEMNGTSIISAVALVAPPASWRIAGIGDFDGNGTSDILWQNSNGQPSIWEMNGTSIVSMTGLPTPPPEWRIVATGDFNGDGKSDILWFNTISDQPAIWEMNGTSIMSAVGLTPQPANMEIIGTGDFAGNGDADILWLNTSTNAPTIWMMNGTSVVSTTTLVAPPPVWRLVGTSDVNGDGKADLLWQNTSDGTVTVWEMNGTSIAANVPVGTPGAAWVLNNNDPPLPSATPPGASGNGGTMHMSMPDTANGTSALSQAGGAVLRGQFSLPDPGPFVGGQATGLPFGFDPQLGAGGGVATLTNTTITNSLHIGSG
jgi:hypothetical protein